MIQKNELCSTKIGLQIIRLRITSRQPIVDIIHIKQVHQYKENKIFLPSPAELNDRPLSLGFFF